MKRKLVETDSADSSDDLGVELNLVSVEEKLYWVKNWIRKFSFILNQSVILAEL